MASGSESVSGPAAVAAGSGGIAIISVDGGGAPELTVRTPDADAGALGSETCLEKKSWKACMASHGSPSRVPSGSWRSTRIQSGSSRYDDTMLSGI